MVAIVVFAAWRIGSRALKNRVLVGAGGRFLLAIFAFAVPFPLIVLGAGCLASSVGKDCAGALPGWGWSRIRGKSYGPAVIDDDTRPFPTPVSAGVRLALLL